MNLHVIIWLLFTLRFNFFFSLFFAFKKLFFFFLTFNDNKEIQRFSSFAYAFYNVSRGVSGKRGGGWVSGGGEFYLKCRGISRILS